MEARAIRSIRVGAVAATLLYFTCRASLLWSVMTPSVFADLAKTCLIVAALALCIRAVPATNRSGYRIGLGQPTLLATMLMVMAGALILYGGVVSWQELRCAKAVQAAQGSLDAEALCFHEIRAKRGI